MIYYLDTNTCIYYMNGRYQSIRDKILSTPPQNIKIPVIVKAELMTGAYKSQYRERTLEKVNIFLSSFQIKEFTSSMAEYYADIRSKFEVKGIIIGPNDLLIASCVLAENGTLVTHNTKEFNRIPNLQLDDWVMPSSSQSTS